MNKFFPTFWLTYTKKILSRSFLFVTILTILFSIGVSNIDKIFAYFDHSEADVTAVSSTSSALQKNVMDALKQSDKEMKVKAVTLSDGKKGVKKGKYTYLIDIHLAEQKYKAAVYTKDAIDGHELSKFQSVITPLQSAYVAQSLNITKNEVQQLSAPAEVENTVLDKKSANMDEAAKGTNTGIVYAGIFLVFLLTVNYGGQAATDIAMEKSSRVIEMIVTSVSPVTHIMSKIVGIVAVALTQIIIIGLALLACIYFFDLGNTLDTYGFKFDHSSVRIIIYSVIFLLLGLLINISLAAIVGALTNRVEDIGQAIMPVTLLNMAAFYIALFSLATPDTMLVKVSSYIPFFTPMVMLLRTTSVKTNDIEIIIGIIICLVTIALLLLLAARIYKGSVFSYGKGLVKNFRQALQMK